MDEVSPAHMNVFLTAERPVDGATVFVKPTSCPTEDAELPSPSPSPGG